MNYKSAISATIMVLRRVTPTGFLICALCSFAIVASAWSATANQPVPVASFDAASASSAKEDQLVPLAVYDTFSRVFPPSPGFGSSWVGVVTVIIGPEVLTGTSRMDVNASAGIATCVFTWVIPGEGTIVVDSVCVLAQNNGVGAWNVKSGTGRFKHFKAIGTETFGDLPDGHAFDMFERFAGIVTHDSHGDDDDDDHGGNH